MKYEYQLTIIFLLIPLISWAEFNDVWKLEAEKEGIKIYTKEVEGAKYKQVKGVTEIHAPIEMVCDILLDYENHASWMDHITESKLISTEGDSMAYVYTVEETVWPAQNRYHVSKMDVIKNEQECTINFEVIPDYMEKRIDAIQMKRQRGFWKISSTEDGGCNIELFIDKNPGGYIPSWLVNSLIVDTPFNMLQNLKEALDNQPRP